MLYAVVEGGLFASGLDPHLGILHADEYNKPTLAFDMIEPFRPMDRSIAHPAMPGEENYGKVLHQKSVWSFSK